MEHLSNNFESLSNEEKKEAIGRLLSAFLETTKAIKSAADNEDVDMLVNKLQERQEIIDQIEALYTHPNIDATTALKAEVGKAFKDTIDAIGQIDAESIRTVNEKRDTLMKQIRSHNNQKMGSNNYGKKAKKVPAVFIDAKK